MYLHESFYISCDCVQQKQLRANKRQEVLLAKRQLGTRGQPPHLVVVVPLSNLVEVEQIHSLLCEGCGLEGSPLPILPPPTLVSTSLKHRFTIAYPSTRHLYRLLDIAKVGVYVGVAD